MQFSLNNSAERLTVHSLVELLGSRSIRVLNTPANTDTVITGTELGDVSEALPEVAGTLAFVVSGAALPTPVLRDVAERATAYGYAAIAMKLTDERREELRVIAEEAGITLLEVAEHVSWRFLEATIAGLLGEQNLLASTSPHPGFEPLFSLVNSVAERFGGSVVVEDLSRNILAYSSIPGQRIDRLRTEGILTRRTPDSPVNDDQYRMLLRSNEVIQFADVGDEVARIAIAIRAGSVPLGTLWAIDGRPKPGTRLTKEESKFVANTAETAATHMLDNLRIQEANQKPRETMFRRLLQGTDVIGTELAELGFSSERGVTICAFTHPHSTQSAITLAQLKYTVAKHYSSYRDEAIAVSLGGTVYVLLGTSDRSEVHTLAERVLPLVDRAVGEGARAALTDSILHAAAAAESKHELDEILRCVTELSEPRVLEYTDAQSHILLNNISDLIMAQPRLQNPALAAVQLSSVPSDVELVHTLETWCSTFGNVARSAELLSIHENTVRYRLKRAAELHGLDLHSPDGLLATWLQLRTVHSNAR